MQFEQHDLATPRAQLARPARHIVAGLVLGTGLLLGSMSQSPAEENDAMRKSSTATDRKSDSSGDTAARPDATTSPKATSRNTTTLQEGSINEGQPTPYRGPRPAVNK